MAKISRFSLAIFEFRMGQFVVENTTGKWANGDLAGFMGKGSYFGFSDMQNDPEGGGWFDISWDWHSQYDQVATGVPLGPTAVSNNGMTFTHQFENRTVWINCAEGTYSLGG